MLSFSFSLISMSALISLTGILLAFKLLKHANNVLLLLLSLEFFSLSLMGLVTPIFFCPSPLAIFSVFVLAVIEAAIGLCLLISSARTCGSSLLSSSIFKLKKLKTFKVLIALQNT